MMEQGYGLRSVFDIEKHKQTFINYFEAIILPSGEVVYAVPSHIEKLIQITGESREVIYDKMPITASPIHWLLDYTGCVSLWSAFHLGEPTTAEQQKTLQSLIEAGLTK